MDSFLLPFEHRVVSADCHDSSALILRLSNGEGTSNRTGVAGNQYGRLTKLEFPKFYGDDVQGWLYRVNQFFLIESIDDNQKIRLASMHMFDKALNWHKQFVRRFGENVEWNVYESEVQKRFDSVFADPMVEIKILKQVSNVQAYQDQFESLLNKVDLSESYAVSLFIGGLKDEVGLAVRMFKPNTLTDVYCLAKMQEATNLVIKGRSAPLLPTPRTTYANTNTYANKNVANPPRNTTTTLALPAPQNSRPAYVQNRILLTQKEIADKRAKVQCFYCDEKFVPGHKCSGQLFSLEIFAEGGEMEGGDTDEALGEQLLHNFEENVVEEPHISLHALTGESTYKTMRVKAYVGKHTVHSLIYSRSTHTFLDLKTAKKLGCKVTTICPMEVSVANGQVINSLFECKGFKWTIQGVEFVSDVLILPLGGCELVLGVQWLSILGTIKWNFKDLVMDFVYNNRIMVLRGTQKATLHWLSGKKTSKEVDNHKTKVNAPLLCIYPNTLLSLESAPTEPLPPQLVTLLEEYNDVFAVPVSLPPPRSHDHTIPLIPNTPPVNIRPYRHPPSQKDAVEAMVKKLKESGVIIDSWLLWSWTT